MSNKKTKGKNKKNNYYKNSKKNNIQYKKISTIKSKKKKKSSIDIFIIILLIILVILLIQVPFGLKKDKKPVKELDPSYVGVTMSDIEALENNIKNDLIYEKEISMIMVGDALIHQSIYQDAYKNGKYDFKKMLSRVKPIISKYDLAYYNQETILGGAELGVSTYPRFNSPYEVGDAFRDAGFNVVSLANNHTLDRGKQAIINSTNYWKKYPKVLVAGSYGSQSDRDKVQIFEKNGITYTMLSYTTDTNGLRIPNGETYLLNVYNENTVKKDIEKVRNKVDLLIVAMHWGQEYTNTPVKEQRDIANYLASLGVDIIIGCHPHVIEPMTFIDNTLVIYSLGNFISSQNTVNQRTGLMASVKIKKIYKEGKTYISLEDATARLVYTYYKNTVPRVNYMIYPYEQLNNDILSNYKTHYNTYINIATGGDKKIQKYPLNP